MLYQALLNVYKRKNIVNSVHVDDWIAELAMIASDVPVMTT